MGRVQRCDRSTVFQLCLNGVDLGKILWVGMDCKLSLSLCIQRCHFAPGQTSFISFAWSLVERLGEALVLASCSCICIRLFMATWMLVGSYVVNLYYPSDP